MNEAQREAICHGDGPARVLAGPGSGKTFVIVHRLKYLIEELNVEPSSILVITFTKAAAEEMQERFYKLMGGTICPVHFGTFHAVFYYILKQSNSNYSKQILSLSDKVNLIKKIKKSFINKFPNKNFPVEEEIIKYIGKYKNSGENFSVFNNKQDMLLEKELFLWVYNTYNELVKIEQKTDFDDMAKQCLELLQSNSYVCNMWQNSFRYILIDEFQDINIPQYNTVKCLAAIYKNLFVVGDDDQAIYGFRGTNPGIMKEFIKDYPECKCILLNINYRSNGAIISAADKCISKNKERIKKRFIPAKQSETLDIKENAVNIKAFINKKEEHEYIIDRLKKWESEGNDYEKASIICRTNFELEEYAFLLKSEKIPFDFKYQNKSIFEHFIMKDIEAYLKIAQYKPDRKLLLQIINRPKRYIGREHFVKEHIGFKELLDTCKYEPDKYSKVEKLMSDCLKISKMRPYLAVNYIRKGIGYDEYLKQEAGSNREVFKELMEYADFFQENSKNFSSLKDWLDAVEIYRQEYIQEDNKKEKCGVHLLTMHGAKGLEFPLVIIPDANEGVIPRGKIISKKEEEEERRIFYVAMTRAKTNLDIYYINGNSERKRLPSRFIQPLLEKQS